MQTTGPLAAVLRALDDGQAVAPAVADATLILAAEQLTGNLCDPCAERSAQAARFRPDRSCGDRAAAGGAAVAAAYLLGRGQRSAEAELVRLEAARQRANLVGAGGEGVSTGAGPFAF